MESTSKKLWNKNFSLLVIGQLISIFGNQVLNFALPLYILDISGSPALFGVVLGVSFLPLIITSPIGGVMADRLKKRRIMFWLDITVTAIILLYIIVSVIFTAAIVPIVIVKLLALNAIQGMYMPAVQASVSVIVPSEKLIKANTATGTVDTISNVAAPAVAGILYTGFGLFPILVVCAICFAVTAIMDLLIRIPYEKQQSSESVIQMVKDDMSQAFQFAVKERPILLRFAAIDIVAGIMGGGVIVVGIPVIITGHLGMGMEHVGIARAIAWAGAFIGLGIVSFLGEKLTIKSVPLSFTVFGLAMVPIGAVLLFDIPYFAAYVIIVVADIIYFSTLYLLTIPVSAYIQKITPPDLIGKVMGLFSALPVLAGGIGFLLAGILFERFHYFAWLIIFSAAFIVCITVLLLRRDFKEEKVDV